MFDIPKKYFARYPITTVEGALYAANLAILPFAIFTAVTRRKESDIAFATGLSLILFGQVADKGLIKGVN
tara:strand:- start:109 stop:318 length:210 start_codon:yes stop_codon:yes gene_type:complete